MVMTLRLHDYPVKALVDRDIENVRVLADAELDVAGYSFPILELATMQNGAWPVEL